MSERKRTGKEAWESNREEEGSQLCSSCKTLGLQGIRFAQSRRMLWNAFVKDLHV